MGRPELTVVVPVGGRHEHLRQCLRSLEGAGIELDVVIVDLIAGSPDAVSAVAADVGSVRVVACAPHPSGALRVGEARNIGAATARTDRLCFLDVDCVVAPGSLGRWCDALDTYRNALLSPTVRFLQEGWQTTVDPQDPVGSDSWLRASAPSDRPVPAVDRVATHAEFDLFWSLAFCCSASTFDRVGGFDTTFIGYGAEDTDFARRARLLRTPLVWLSGGMAFHQFHPPSRLDRTRLGQLVANAVRFRARWGDWPMGGWLDELSELGLVEWNETTDELRVIGAQV